MISYVHNELVTPEVEAHYREMFEIATAIPWRHEKGVVIPRMEVISVLYPKKIPQENVEDRFYTRREPFEDPVEEV